MNIQETVLKVIQATKPNLKSINLHSMLFNDLELSQLDILNICHQLDSIYNTDLTKYKFTSVADIVNAIDKNNDKNITSSNIYDGIKEILITNDFLTKDTILPNSRLIEDLGMDSLEFVDFIMAIEKHFGISIPDLDAGNISTVSDVYNCVQKELIKKQQEIVKKPIVAHKNTLLKRIFTKTR